jgi:hypothetical protein
MLLPAKIEKNDGPPDSLAAKYAPAGAFRALGLSALMSEVVTAQLPK